MKELKEAPESGQFVMVWEYQGSVFSSVYRFDDGSLALFDEVEDEWVDTSGLLQDIFDDSEIETAKYFVI